MKEKEKLLVQVQSYFNLEKESDILKQNEIVIKF